MFAVIRTGGKQYRVEPGNVIDVEKLTGDTGDSVEFSEVLLLNADSGVKVGQPVIEGSSVSAIILEQKKGPKLTIFKKIRRKGKQLTKGHRQNLTRVRIENIC